MDSDDSEKTPPNGTPKPPMLAISAWDVNRRPPRPDSTGKQVHAMPSIKRAPPPVAKMVSFSPPAPARTGNTNPGGLQTRVDSPHSKQKTPPNGIPSAAVPATGPGRVVGLPHASRLKDPSGSAPKAAPPSSRPRSLQVGEKAGPAPAQADPIPSIRSIPSYSRFATLSAALSSLLFPKSPTRMAVTWGVITVAVLSPVLGAVMHSCQEEKPEQKIEQAAPKKETKVDSSRVETKAAPKPTSFYIPKALRNPPQIPNRIPQRIARNSLRS